MSSWELVRIGDLLTESKVESKSPSVENRIRVRLNLGGVEKRPLTAEKEGATKYFIRKAGQFIYGKQNLHKGAFGIVPIDLDGFESSADIPAFDVNSKCLPEWIFYFFKQGNYYLKLEQLAKGVGSKRIQPSQIYDLRIPLPDLEVQRKILDNVNLLEEKLAKLSHETSNQLQLLDKLRLSLLTEATTGKLTTQWRTTNSNVNQDGPAAHQNEYRFSGEVLPKSWKSLLVADVITDIRYGTSKKCDYGLGDTFVLRIPNVVSGEIDLTDLKSTSLTKKEKNAFSLLEGDILLIRSNGSSNLVGRTAVATHEVTTFAFAGYLMRIRLSDVITPEYFNIVFKTPFVRNLIERNLRTTTGVKNINTEEVCNLPLSLPPVAEQNVIVASVENEIVKQSEMYMEITGILKKAEQLFHTKLQELFKTDQQLVDAIDIDSARNAASEYFIKKNNSKNDLRQSDMELLELLESQKKLSAIDLWKMSKYSEDIDGFYAELKKQIEQEKTIKETADKAYLELA